MGIGAAAFGTHVAVLFPGQPLAGGVVIALGALLCGWAVLYFRSWRFRAALEVGHELATGGPFRFLRHPIYMSLNLLALGSALWLPAPILWVAVVLMIAGSELRARAEDSLLRRSFGDAYVSYCKRTARFVPGVY
jgi:protein-S-isoprenylcysteine O-methyltransferase Ste14